MTTDPYSEANWPAARSLLTCAFLPATTARRTNHVLLRQAYVVHFGAALLGFFVIVFLDAWGDAAAPASFTSVGRHFLRSIAGIANRIAEASQEFVLSIVGMVLVVEAGYFVVAYLVMPWGAGDESISGSFRHALRRTWLQTPHVVFVIAAIGLIAVPLSRADHAWLSAYPIAMPEPPNLAPPSAPPEKAAPDSQAWKDYENAMENYNQVWQDHWSARRLWDAEMRRGQPWYLRYHEAIAVDFGFFSGLWLLGALLRSVGAARTLPQIVHPPRCDACGYNLTTIPMESRCPECGETVAASLGPDARPGAPWQRRAEIGCFAAWRRSMSGAIRDPLRFGRMLRLTSPGVDHRRFLVVHLPLVFLIGAISPYMMYLAVERRSPIPKEIEFVIIAAPVFGTVCTIGAIVFSLLSAASVGVRFHIRERRNLLVGSVQVVCYLFPYLIAWQVFGAVTAISAACIGRSEWFEALTQSRRVDPAVLAFFLWFIPNLVCALLYWALVNRAVSSTRYANK